jgi:hypothetical protein
VQNEDALQFLEIMVNNGPSWFGNLGDRDKIYIYIYIYSYWKETEGTQDQMKFSRNKGSTQDQMIIII